MIVGELAPLAPEQAMARLLDFLATCDQTYERVDDDAGKLQAVYDEALEKLAIIAGSMKKTELDALPAKITDVLFASDYLDLNAAVRAVCGLMSPKSLRQWDALLKERQQVEADPNDAIYMAKVIRKSRIESARQLLAFMLGDIDAVLALEGEKHAHLQNSVGIASYLLKNCRAEEALAWIRQKQDKNSLKPNYDSGSYDCYVDEDYKKLRPSLRYAYYETKILEFLGDKNAAQQRRWEGFKLHLSPELLRDYVNNLPDFEEFATLDKAFDHVMNSDELLRALSFFITWPRLDLASRLVIKNNGRWDGDDYHSLPDAAKALEHEHPLAATILYRALVEAVLAKKRRRAYNYAANYCKKLRDLAREADKQDRARGFWRNHETYMKKLFDSHRRNRAFWELHDVR